MHPLKRFILHPATLLTLAAIPYFLFFIAWFMYILYISAQPIFSAAIAFFVITIILCLGFLVISFLPTFNTRIDKFGKVGARLRVVYRVAMATVAISSLALAIALIIFTYKPNIWTQMDVDVSEIGAVNATAAKLWFRTRKFDRVIVRYKPAASTGDFVSTAPVRLDPDRDYTANVVLTGLSPRTLYTFYAAMVSSTGQETAWETRNLTTRPVDGTSAGKFRFSFGSCVMRQFPDFWTPIESFKQIAAKKPDLFLLIGDQIYGDLPIPLGIDSYPAEWRDAKADPNYQLLANQVPVYQQYDDHEVFDNWDAGETGIFPEAMRLFDIYGNSHNPDPVAPDTRYYTIQHGDVAFFVLDTRRYRTPSVPARGQPAPANRTMLGSRQLQHLFSWMDQVGNTAKWKFIVSTVPWTLNTEDDDSWFGYSVERKTILDGIVARNMSGTVLLSADSHWSAVFQVQKGIYEFVLSPLGAFSALGTSQGRTEPELAFLAGTSYFSMIDIDTTAPEAPLDLKIFAAKNPSNPLYSLNLPLSSTTTS